MWQKFGEFQAGTDFLAWGTTIAFYRTLEFRKRTKRSGMPQFEEHIFKMIQTKAAQQANEDNLYIDKLRDCIKKMKKDDQYLIDLRYWQNIDVKNISVRLGHSARSVYYNLARVQRLLIHCINRNTSAEAR
jgi:RNA polymerase sigma-70 factor (ECF subfamily)